LLDSNNNKEEAVEVEVVEAVEVEVVEVVEAVEVEVVEVVEAVEVEVVEAVVKAAALLVRYQDIQDTEDTYSMVLPQDQMDHQLRHNSPLLF
jgi:hypothetical protein